MFKLSKLADYAVVVLAALDHHPDAVSASVLAAETRLPEPTAAKILKILSGAGLVTSTRGIKGGYVLTKPLTELNIKDVISAIDGPIALTACVDRSEGGGCELSGSCAMHSRWDKVNAALTNALENVTLASMLSSQNIRNGL